MLIKFNDNIKNAKTYTFYNDPGHAWLKIPFSDLVKLGIENDITTYSYMRGKFAYLEEDQDFSTFRKAMEQAGMNFRIKETKTNNYSTIRQYRHYTAEQFRVMPAGIIGEYIIYAGQKYQITHNLMRHGFQVLHINSGMYYRLPRKALTESQKI
jgi:hypothetical protein